MKRPALRPPGPVTELRARNREVAVATGSGLLIREEVELQGKARRRATEVIRSIRIWLGMDTCAEIAALRDRLERAGPGRAAAREGHRQRRRIIGG
jgi:hypothetical protein